MSRPLKFKRCPFNQCAKLSYAQNPLDTFPRNLLPRIYGEVADLLPTCCGLVGDTASYVDMSRYR